MYWSNVQDDVPLADLGEVLSADGSNRVVRFAKKEVKDKVWTLSLKADMLHHIWNQSAPIVIGIFSASVLSSKDVQAC